MCACKKQERIRFKIFGAGVTFILILGWIIARVTAEELFLRCLPPSISVGIIASHLFEGLGKCWFQFDENLECAV